MKLDIQQFYEEKYGLMISPKEIFSYPNDLA